MRTYTAILTLCLIAAAFKDDSATIAASTYWFTLTNNPVTEAIKHASQLMLLSGCAIATISFRTAPEAIAKTLPFSAIYAICSFIAISIASLYDTSIAIRTAAGAIVFIAIYNSTCASILEQGIKKTSENATRALSIYSIILIACNAGDYFSGHGYVIGNARLFGSASHPNFLGVQLAVACLALFATTPFYRKHYLKLAVFGTTCFGLFLLKESGSRTGLVTFGSGLTMMICLRRRWPATVAIILLAISAAMLYILKSEVDITSLGESFTRGHGNEPDTRSAAWALMLSKIERSPLIGYGQSIEASENSFLRGSVAYGLPYALLLMSGILWTLLKSTTQRVVVRSTYGALFGGITTGLCIGSIFEGYFIDALSIPIVALAIITPIAVWPFDTSSSKLND